MYIIIVVIILLVLYIYWQLAYDQSTQPSFLKEYIEIFHYLKIKIKIYKYIFLTNYQFYFRRDLHWKKERD